MKWEVEETILLIDLYYKTVAISSLNKNELIRNLSLFLNQRKRKVTAGLPSNFRNITGVTMQLNNIQFLVTNGKRGLSSYSELQKKMLDLYEFEFNTFSIILKKILDKYNLDELYRVKFEVKDSKKKIFDEHDLLVNFKKYMMKNKHISEPVAAKMVGLFQELSAFAIKTGKSERNLTEISDKREFLKTADSFMRDKHIKNYFKGNDVVTVRYSIIYYFSFISEVIIEDNIVDADERIDNARNLAVNNAKVSAAINSAANTVYISSNLENDFLNWIINKVMMPEGIAQYNISAKKNYLRNKEKAKKAAIKYINVIKKVELFAKTNEIINFSFFENRSISEVTKVIEIIKSDERYVALDITKRQLITRSLNNFTKFMTSREYDIDVVANKIESVGIEDRIISTTSSDYENERINISINEERKQKLLNIMSEHFKKGFKLNSVIDTKKFCYFYKEKYGIELQYDGESLGKILCDICIKYESERIMSIDNVVNEDTLNEIVDYILKSFKEGKQAIYYEGLFSQFSDRLLNTNVYNKKVLKELLSFYFGNKYNFRRSYMTVSDSISIDTSSEVEAILRSNGSPMQFELIAEELSHIAEAKLQQILRGINFVASEDNCYTHISMYEISEMELDIIRIDIQELLVNKRFIAIRKLFSVLSEKRAEFLERNVISNATCLRDVLTYYLRKDFAFKSSFIGKIGEEITVSGMIHNFAKGKDTFTLNELAALGNELGINVTQGVYIESILQDHIRLNSETFARLNLLHFDIQAVDEAISKFCIVGYTSLSSIDRFAIFPTVGIAWNSYLLESYVNHFSKQFKVMSYSFSVKKSIGAVVDIATGFKYYDEVLADLAYKNNHLDLQNEENVIEYFYNNGYIAKRRLKPYIGNILSIARRIKQSKGM